MNGAPVDVTILPAEPGSGYAVTVFRDPFDDYEPIGEYVDLGAVIAWRFETYFDGARVFTVRQPIGVEDDPSGDDWSTEVHPDIEAHRVVLAALDEAVEVYKRRHTTTEENES